MALSRTELLTAVLQPIKPCPADKTRGIGSRLRLTSNLPLALFRAKHSPCLISRQVGLPANAIRTAEHALNRNPRDCRPTFFDVHAAPLLACNMENHSTVKRSAAIQLIKEQIRNLRLNVGPFLRCQRVFSHPLRLLTPSGLPASYG